MRAQITVTEKKQPTNIKMQNVMNIYINRTVFFVLAPVVSRKGKRSIWAKNLMNCKVFLEQM